MPRSFVFVLALAALASAAGCNASKVSIGTATMLVVTPSVDAQTLLSPTGPQHVALGNTQSFAVNAMSGYAVSSLVGGTCPIGHWTSNIYKTGIIVNDCTVIFESTRSVLDVAVAGDHVVVSPAADITVQSGSVQPFTVTADAGYELSQSVGGTCPSGTWSGVTYTTGAIDANCTVVFSAIPIHFMVTPVATHVTTAPAAAQPVLWGSGQTFGVVPASGYTIDANVAGTCAPGTWNGNDYTTGAINANCTVGFNGALAQVAVPAMWTPGLAVTPTTAYAVPGASADFNVTVQPGYVLNNNVTTTCGPGSWSGTVYTTPPLTGACEVAFEANVTTPVVVAPLIATTEVVRPNGGMLFNLQWQPAVDAGTPMADLNYTVCVSQPDPQPGSFATLSQMANASYCISQTGTTQLGLPVGTGHAYFFNVMVTNLTGAQAIYQAKGEYAADALLNYVPFEGNANDVLGGLGFRAPALGGVTGHAGALTSDRSGNPDAAYQFVANNNQCLASSTPLDTSVVGHNPRTIAFWLKTDVAGYGGSPLGLAGVASLQTGDHFGLYHDLPSGSGAWNLWLYGEDVATSQVYHDQEAWEFWVLTYSGDPSQTATAYRNGVRAAQQSGPWGTTPSAGAYLFLGCGVDGPLNTGGALTRFFDGAVDDIRIFNEVLCDGTSTNGCSGTDNAIANLYNIGLP